MSSNIVILLLFAFVGFGIAQDKVDFCSEDAKEYFQKLQDNCNSGANNEDVLVKDDQDYKCGSIWLNGDSTASQFCYPTTLKGVKDTNCCPKGYMFYNIKDSKVDAYRCKDGKPYGNAETISCKDANKLEY